MFFINLQGKNLPFGAIAYAAALPYQDTFLLVGGTTVAYYNTTDDNATDAIYKYVLSSDDWHLMPTRLRLVIQYFFTQLWN